MHYELGLPQKNEEDGMKIFCCYHTKNFEQLNENQKNILFDHHFTALVTK
jgi:hypothetical protein